MSFPQGAALLENVLFAAETTKNVNYVGVAVIGALLLVIIVLMLRSLGFNSKTPPSMVFRKMLVFIKSFYAPILLGKKLAKGEELHDNGKLAEALDVYLSVFYFDGLTSTRHQIAIHNESILERIEEVAEETSYTYPLDRISRFQDDLYDYFLVKMKYLAPSDYDGTPLHRPENEERFRDKLNLSQERQLIESFEHFLTTLVHKIQQHIKSGAKILPRGTRTSAPREAIPPMEEAFVSTDTPSASMDPFGSAPSEGQEVGPPPDLFGGSTSLFGEAEQAEELPSPPADPFASPVDPFGHSSSGPAVEVSAPDDLFAQEDQNPFSINDPHDPFNESTGVLHKLPGAVEDQGLLPPAPVERNTQGSVQAIQPPTIPQPSIPSMPAVPGPQPTGGFPGLGAPTVAPPMTAPMTPPGPAMNHPTGGFPQPTGGFPGFAAPTNNFAATPTNNGFPGLGPGQVGQTPQAPQPTGGFPGFNASNPVAQPTASGAFPNVGINSGMPQPTGGFPGFTAPSVAAVPPLSAGMPQPTGGFPGFTGSSAGLPAMNTGGFPQPTGGFPGFAASNPNAAPLPPNPFQMADKEKK